jgi:hypothetical protein
VAGARARFDLGAADGLGEVGPFVLAHEARTEPADRRPGAILIVTPM